MIRSIYTKTLYQKRWMLLAWTLGLGAMAGFTLAFYPALRNSNLGAAFQDLPPALANLVGDNSGFTTVSGYVGEQLFGLRMPMMTIILAIVVFANLTASEEDRGAVAEQLTLPISRTRLLLEKFLAGASILLIGHIGILIGTVITLGLIHETLPFIKLVEAVFNCWLISMVFAGLTFGLGAATGSKAWTIGLASYITFQTYLISSLAGSIDQLKTAEKFSPFYYYQNPAAMHGLQLNHVIILVLTTAIPALLGWLIFRQRDLKN